MSTLTRNSLLALVLLVASPMASWAESLIGGEELANAKPKVSKVLPPSPPSISNANVIVCGYENVDDPRSTVLVNASGCDNGTIQWYNSDGADLGTGSPKYFTISSETHIHATCKVGSEESTPSNQIHVPYLKAPVKRPIVIAEANGSDKYVETCEGNSLKLYSTVDDSAYLYSWERNGAAGNFSPTTAGLGSPRLTVDIPGYYNLVVRSKECPNVAVYAVNTVYAQFYERPTKPIITGDSLFCEDKSVSLKADSSRFVAKYQWFVNGLVQDSLGTTSLIKKFNKTATIQVRTLDSRLGCQSFLSEPVNLKALRVPAKPTITASKKGAAICQGDTLSLTSSLGFKYLWNNGATTASLKGIRTVGKYAVQVIDTSGCVSPTSDTTQITVYALPAKPSVSADGPLAFCDGFNVNLTSSAQSKYIWSTLETTKSIKITKSGSYTVAVRDTNNCLSPSSDAVLVTVYALPAKPTITVKGDGKVTFCADRSVVLESSNLASGEATKYRWTTTDSTRSITIKVTTKAAVRVIDPRGCVSPLSDTVSINVLPLPDAPTLSAEGPLTFCSRDVTNYAKENSVKLIATTAVPAHEVTWNTGLVSKILDNVKISGQYTATSKDANGCVSARSTPIVVTIKESPSAATASIAPDGAFTLKAVNFPDGTDYEWKYESETTPLSSILASVKADRNGNYSVRRKVVYTVPAPLNTLVCYTDFSKQFNFQEDPDFKGLSIYPNPSNGVLTVETLKNWEKVSITIYDIIGRLIYTGTVPSITGKLVVDLKNQPEGTYLFRFEADGFELTKRVIINR
jgi:hypothetical protein